jgi:uncharacterized membrane protein required for colicin V production
LYWLDTTILIVVLVGAGLGFWSGLLWQVARVVCLALALYATLVFNDAVTEMIQEHLARGADPRVLHGSAYVGVFIATYLALFLVARLLQKTIRAARLEAADRLLGACLGAAKMAVVVALACSALAGLALPPTQEWMSRSLFAPYFAHGTEAGFALIPEEYRTQVTDNLQLVRDTVQRKFAEEATRAE